MKMEPVELNINILLVEDDAGAAFLVTDMLSEVGQGKFNLHHVKCRKHAEQQLDQRPFDVVLLDLGLPESRGLETLRHMLDRFPEQSFIVLSGLADEDTAVKSMSMGAKDFLLKGKFEEQQLLETILTACQKQP